MEQKSEKKHINNNSGTSLSLWMEVTLPPFTSLDQNLKTEICIIGSGITGLTCAYTLAKKGHSVVVVDSGAIAGGQTARTTGHLTWVLDDRFEHLEKLFGLENTQLAADSHSKAIDYIEQIIKEEKIDCDFERLDAYLFTHPGDSKKILHDEASVIQKIGRPVNKVDNAPFSSSFETGLSLQFPHQAQFHILKYLKGLTKALLKYGVQIYADTHIEDIEEKKTCIIKTKTGHTINSQSLIVATCTPINNRFIIHTKQAAYRTYVIGTTIPKEDTKKALYWDTLDPYHYIRIQEHPSDKNLYWLIIGGEDHKTGQDKEIDKNYKILEKWARKRFPTMGEIDYQWSGQIFEPVDSLAFIGRNPGNENIYIATGDSGNGLTHGTIAGLLIPDLILKNKNPWESLYSPSRITFSASGEYLKENINTAFQYRDWLTPGEAKKIDSLNPEEGIVIRKGIQKFAVFKDKNNQVSICSAFCPHLGGAVRWNKGEKSWDCPCHGSRFDGYGNVITGPALSNLSQNINFKNHLEKR